MKTKRKSGMIHVSVTFETIDWNERHQHILKAEKWCEENWIAMDKGPEGKWNNRGPNFWFKDEDAAALFKLTWG